MHFEKLYIYFRKPEKILGFTSKIRWCWVTLKYFFILALVLTSADIGSYSRTQNNNSVRLKPGTSLSQVEHSTTEPLPKAGMIHKLSLYRKL